MSLRAKMITGITIMVVLLVSAVGFFVWRSQNEILVHTVDEEMMSLSNSAKAIFQRELEDNITSEVVIATAGILETDITTFDSEDDIGDFEIFISTGDYQERELVEIINHSNIDEVEKKRKQVRLNISMKKQLMCFSR